MFQSIGRSIELAKASLAVLRSDKELLVFPFVSFIALAIVTITFAVPFILVGGIDAAARGEMNIASYVVAFLFYLASYTVVFFCNTALVGAAMIRLDGGNPTLADGFGIAFSRLPQIVGYALIAATVGMILRWISERAGIVGQLVVGLIGFAWNVATFLVVPVLAYEKLGPIAAVKRSGSLLRQTWGEQLAGNVGIGLFFLLIGLLVLVIGIAVVVALAQVAFVLAVAAAVVVALAIGVVALVGSATSGIFTASLYRYATKGDAGEMYRPETLSAAFQARR